MRFRYRITFIDPTIYETTEKNMFQEDVPVQYQRFRATDGTPDITFTGSCAANEFQVDDIISAEMLDTRYPTLIGHVILESRHVEPPLLEAPEPIELPIEPAQTVPQADELLVAIANGQCLSNVDLLALARRFVVLEKQFKAHCEKCDVI